MQIYEQSQINNKIIYLYYIYLYLSSRYIIFFSLILYVIPEKLYVRSLVKYMLSFEYVLRVNWKLRLHTTVWGRALIWIIN